MTIMIPIKKNTDKQNFINRFFGDEFLDDFVNRPISMLSGEGYFGRVNVSENIENYQLEIMVPGVAKTDINIKVANGKELIIKLDKEKETVDENVNYIRREFAAHKFERHFALPDDVREDSINAEFKNGILFLTLNKVEPEAPENIYKDIEIQ